jgi:hypothetical protein
MLMTPLTGMGRMGEFGKIILRMGLLQTGPSAKTGSQRVRTVRTRLPYPVFLDDPPVV